jgi:hypothetical protein
MSSNRRSLGGALCAAWVISCSAGGTGSGSGPVGTGSGGGTYVPITTGTGGDTTILPSSGGDPGLVIPPGGTGGTTGVPPTTLPPPTDAPVNIDECGASNPAGIDGPTAQKLQAGSGSAGDLKILNPYDGTVFPRGLIAPLLMWSGGAGADLVYLHMKSSGFEYKGCLRPTAAGQLQIPQSIWDQATAHTGGAKDPFTIELTTSAGGNATGPVVEKIVVAQATLKGTIFYNSYKSKLVKPTDLIGAFTGGQGAVLRLVPGKQADVFLGQTTCTGCHAVSASGTRMVSSLIDMTGTASTSGGSTYAIPVGAPPAPPQLVKNATSSAFAGVSPDGSLYLSNGHPGGMGTRTGASVGAPNASLFETDTGTEITSSGVPAGAMTPIFSPSGTQIAFNDYAIGNGHGLATMTFDPKARTAAGYKKVFELTDQTKFPGWPFFLPDEKGLIFAVGSESDFSGKGTGIDVNGLPAGANATSDLYILDIASGTSKLLANAMGFATDQDAQSGNTYLPGGSADLHHTFYPTVSPVAAGGYFWVFFDSFRHYGNTHANAPVRQLWGTAVDIHADGTYTTDPSHPAFYLTGQEDVAGNHRAFTALDPCHKDGDACATGIDCCGGFCTNGVCAVPPPPVMGPPPCSHTDEKCATASDCCNSGDRCISGFCGQILQ